MPSIVRPAAIVSPICCRYGCFVLPLKENDVSDEKKNEIYSTLKIIRDKSSAMRYTGKNIDEDMSSGQGLHSELGRCKPTGIPRIGNPLECVGEP